MKSMNTSGGATLHGGLKRSSPPASDASMKPSKGHVNDDAVRVSTAGQPGSLGPRTA